MITEKVKEFGYEIELNYMPIGEVYKELNRQAWYFRNDKENWFGQVRTKKEAVAALVGLALRNGY